MLTVVLSPTARVIGEHPEYRIETSRERGDMPAHLARAGAKSRKGEIVWEPMGWYANLPDALRAAVKRGLLVGSGEFDALTLARVMDQAADRIVAALAVEKAA